MADFEAVPPPEHLFRLARRHPDPFAPPDWAFAGPDGTFGNRFDDPHTDRPLADRFRVIYCTTQRRGAFAETLARFRPSPRLVAQLAMIDDDEPVGSSLHGVIDPIVPTRGLVGASWRLQRVMGQTQLAAHLRFVDLGSAKTLQHLRENIDRWSSNQSLDDVDQGTLLGSDRTVTQRIARYVYDQRQPDGSPRFAGLRYISRLGQDWECWAIFSDRMVYTPGMPSPPQTIPPDDADLLAIASLFSLTIETFEGSGLYLRP